jgi:glycosyltransferase involved in cell wall biosynthesis
MTKLAIVTSHPIQYYAPWCRHLAAMGGLDLKVFYLWDFGAIESLDVGFQQKIRWDIPLLDGYEYEFVPNISTDPGTHHFWGLNNPELSERVNGYQPDAVLLLNYNYASIYRFLWEQRHSSVPLLFRGDSHRLVANRGIKESLRRQFISFIYRQFAAILYVGKANYDYFTYHGIAEDKLFFTPHAVDNDRFFASSTEAIANARTWRQELGIPESNSVILFAGKFEAKKRPTDLITAFLSTDLEAQNVSLVFVGSGDLEGEMRSLAAGHPSIHIVPFQNQSLMPRTYAAADVVVLPSYGAGETWGLAINEAMCLSRPIIASDLVGCASDLIEPHGNGLIFSAGDVSALTASLKEAFRDRERLVSWGKRSREIIENYSYTNMTLGLRSALNYLDI